LLWTTERERTWSDANSAQVAEVKPNGRGWVDSKVRFRTDAPLTGLQLNPVVANPELGMRLEIDAMMLTHLAEEPGRDVQAK
jgi:hypothetical protein